MSRISYREHLPRDWVEEVAQE